MIPLNEHLRGNSFQDFSDVIITQYSMLDAIKTNKIRGQNCVIFCKTDYVESLFEALNGCNKSHVLITHNSDNHINEERYSLKPPCIKTWFARNVEIERPGLIPIPIGIENENEGISGDIDVMNEARLKKEPYKSLAYMNFTIRTNRKERQPCVEILKNEPFVNYNMVRESFPEHCRLVCSHSFTLSPPGNGVDCHRTWEALFMGVTPIVKRSINMNAFSGLDIMFVDNWSEVTEDSLSEHKRGCYSYDKMTYSYWKNRVQEERRLL